MSQPIRDRLIGCFESVFPGQSADTLLTATPDSISTWDSSNHFMLLQVVEEEFKITIPERDGGELLSFDEMERYLASKV